MTLRTMQLLLILFLDLSDVYYITDSVARPCSGVGGAHRLAVSNG